MTSLASSCQVPRKSTRCGDSQKEAHAGRCGLHLGLSISAREEGVRLQRWHGSPSFSLLPRLPPQQVVVTLGIF